MIPKDAILRIARPTNHLEAVTKMYCDGLGFKEIGSFDDHEGFDGRMVGHPWLRYHLEFTQHRSAKMPSAPSQDNLLGFYIPETKQWRESCEAMTKAGFRVVNAYNPYWDRLGKTFEDLDGYRVVLQNATSPV